MPLLVLKNFRLVDETTDIPGTVIVEDGVIKVIFVDTDNAAGSGSDGASNFAAKKEIERAAARADIVLDGGAQNGGAEQRGEARNLALMPAFVDLHAHFREPGFPEKETLESASLAAAAGGYGTIVCMANTSPVTDTLAQARAIKNRNGALGLVDVYPALSLTRGMEGKALSEITLLKTGTGKPRDNIARLVSEDGKDVADDALFFAAMIEARQAGIPVSCHCDLGGENNATKRAITLAKQTACRLHIAHVSTKEAAAMIREAKQEAAAQTDSPPRGSAMRLSCEVTPHHIALSEQAAAALGINSHGKVSPPLRSEEDRRALIEAIADGTIDAIATDHAPHTLADKENGAPGFSGLETAFAVCYSALAASSCISLSKLSSLMSAAPARILGLADGSEGRGRIARGMRADFAIADLAAVWAVDPAAFKSRGKNSPFTGKELRGKIITTIHGGRIVSSI